MPKTHLKQFYQLDKDIIENSDIIMSLRTQTERHNKIVYASLQDYANDFCIQKILLKTKTHFITSRSCKS